MRTEERKSEYNSMSPDISLPGIGNGTGELTFRDFDRNLCIFLTLSLFHLSYLGSWVNSFRHCAFRLQHCFVNQILTNYKFLDGRPF